MKEAADLTLAEVQRKISETNNCMKLIGRLRKLRQLRKDQAERKGCPVHISSHHFMAINFSFKFQPESSRNLINLLSILVMKNLRVKIEVKNTA